MAKLFAVSLVLSNLFWYWAVREQEETIRILAKEKGIRISE